jgi:hypothetical protein
MASDPFPGRPQGRAGKGGVLLKNKRPRPQAGGAVSVTVGTVSTSDPITPPPAQPSRVIPIRDKLTWDLADIASLTGLSRRLLERELSAGRWPRPDIRIGRRCLWIQTSVLAHLDSLADRQKGGARR